MKTLNELFNTPVSYKQTPEGYLFKIGEIKYLVDIDKETEEWVIAFGSQKPNEKSWNTKITNTGNELQVFATVIKIIKDVIKKGNPYSLTFTAKEKSRIKLYRKMSKLIGKGWDISEHKFGPETHFYLVQPWD